MFDTLFERYIETKEKSWFGMKQKLLFFRELSYLLWWWIGIQEAVAIIARDWDTSAQRYIWNQIAISTNEGKTLTNAMVRLGEYFGASDIAIIKSWESSGNLVTVLRSLSAEYAFLYSLRNKFIAATTYPVVLLWIAMIAIIVLFVWILPGIFSIATEFKWIELPFVTRMMMWFSNFLRNNVWSLLIGIWLTLFLWSIIFSTESWKSWWFRTLLKVPGFGLMIRNYYIVKMMRYLKLLYQSGMNYVDSLTLLRDIMWAGPYSDMLQNTIQYVQRWEVMYKWMVEYPHLIPANATVLMKVWEETAQLPETIQNIVDTYEEDLMTRIWSVSKIIEPILIVVLWVVITLIALSVFGIITTILWWVQGS
jgi:type II secretory pathway component PulF